MLLIRPLFALALIIFAAMLQAHSIIEPLREEPACSCANAKEKHKQAIKKYAKAFKESFEEHWREADEISKCAAMLDHDTTDWPVNAKEFSDRYLH